MIDQSHVPLAVLPPGKAVDIIFINPSMDWKFDREKRLAVRIENYVANQESPNIGVGYMMAVARQHGLTSAYLDMVMDCLSPEQVLEIVRESKPALIGMSAYTVQIKAAGKLATLIKEASPQTQICVGGPHVKALPIESLAEFPSFDFVVIGEAEDILPQIVDALGKVDELAKIPGVITRGKTDLSLGKVKDYDALPFPAWDLFRLTNYPGCYPHRTRMELPMITARGCPYSCTFCCNALGRVYRRRSLENVMAEIERNVHEFGCESIAFLDETFYLRKDWMKEFCDALVDRGFHKKVSWSCSTRVSGTDPELFQMMRRAGCYYIFFGLESAEEATLRRIHKGTTIDMMRNTVRWAKDAGIVPVGAFIIGLEGSTPEETVKAIELARELDLYSVTFPIAVPFPGSPLRDIALEGKYGLKVLSNDWDHYGKQECQVMETDDFPVALRKQLQERAYAAHPKKKLNEYVRKLESRVASLQAASA